MSKGRWAGVWVAALLACAGAPFAMAHPGHVHPAPEVDEFEVEGALSRMTHPLEQGVDYTLVLIAGMIMAGLFVAAEIRETSRVGTLRG